MVDPDRRHGLSANARFPEAVVGGAAYQRASSGIVDFEANVIGPKAHDFHRATGAAGS